MLINFAKLQKILHTSKYLGPGKIMHMGLVKQKGKKDKNYKKKGDAGTSPGHGRNKLLKLGCCRISFAKIARSKRLVSLIFQLC